MPVLNLSPMAKTIAAFVLGLVVFVAQLVADRSFGIQDVIALAGWLGVALGVYVVPNKPAAGSDIKPESWLKDLPHVDSADDAVTKPEN